MLKEFINTKSLKYKDNIIELEEFLSFCEELALIDSNYY